MTTRISKDGEWQEKITCYKDNEKSDDVILAVNYGETNEQTVGVLKGEKFAKYVMKCMNLKEIETKPLSLSEYIEKYHPDFKEPRHKSERDILEERYTHEYNGFLNALKA